MYEKEKLEEAKYFYSRMIEEQENIRAFKYYLSAFLSSARSVLQYAEREAKKKPGGKKWYDNYISNNPILKFFKHKRDINIHVKPVQPSAHIDVEIIEPLHISESVSITVTDEKGNIKHQFRSEKPKPAITKPTMVKVMYKYRFKDWKGNEDVLELCQKYIEELEKIVKDGIKRGFITG